MSGTNILMNCSTLAIHIFSMVISLIILALIIYRFHYNKLYRRQISSSPFDDQISLILIGNIYLVFFIYHITWLSIIFRTFIGDFSLLKDHFYFGDYYIVFLKLFPFQD
ncbi:unnamed protein product [Adineta steineri]|uniref:Uncharacterized protein n=1 Tax=Adineta steineri TaxID=433720 RepID=A0A819DP51_9BILA|nr:unnamed protein product [Adineta steineri]